MNRATMNEWVYGVAFGFVLGTTAAYAAGSAGQERVAPAPVQLAQSAPPQSKGTPLADESRAAFPPQQAGVRRAAAEGSTALRRYVTRTRMIYNYSYWDFAKYLPAE